MIFSYHFLPISMLEEPIYETVPKRNFLEADNYLVPIHTCLIHHV